MKRSTKTALKYTGGGLAVAGALYYLSRPTALLTPPVAPTGAATLQPVALPLPTVPLIRGRHYYVAASISSVVHAFASVAQVVAYAKNKGLANTQAYLAAGDIPAWWPAGAGAQGNVWVEGDWSQVSQQANLPSQIVAAWILGPEV